jgi:glutaredoxin-related protein
MLFNYEYVGKEIINTLENLKKSLIKRDKEKFKDDLIFIDRGST